MRKRFCVEVFAIRPALKIPLQWYVYCYDRPSKLLRYGLLKSSDKSGPLPGCLSILKGFILTKKKTQNCVLSVYRYNVILVKATEIQLGAVK